MSKEEHEKTILLASPRGFCAGVIRAIDTVEYALKITKTPLYVFHEIVHNATVIQYFEKKGVRFIEDLNDVPNNSPVILSAHGVSPQIQKLASKKNLLIVDATCPLVAKVHVEAVRFRKKEQQILFIGHRRHAETAGVVGEAPQNITVIENEDEARQVTVKDPEAVSCLTQTTLSIYDTNRITKILLERFPGMQMPKSSDICYATTNRQDAVIEISKNTDIIIVIGSKNSSNSNRLRETAEKQGIPSYLIDSASEIQESWFPKGANTVGLTSGASAPEHLLEETIGQLIAKFGFLNVEVINIKDENTVFQPPLELKDLERWAKKGV